jgi:hypothetical protein
MRIESTSGADDMVTFVACIAVELRVAVLRKRVDIASLDHHPKPLSRLEAS